MTNTQKYRIQDGEIDEDELLALPYYSDIEENSTGCLDIDEDELLALSHSSDSEFDYSLDLLGSDYGKPAAPSLNTLESRSFTPTEDRKLSKEALPEKQTTVMSMCHNLFPRQTQSIHDFEIDADDFKSTADVLDLQRMAERFAELKRSKRTEKNVYEEVGDFDLEALIRTDRMLEEAHNMIYKEQGQMDRETRVSLQNSILRMIDLPHLYVPMPPKKRSRIRVEDWLNNQTSSPEPEMCGFTVKDPIMPRKYVPEVHPRLSASVTNVVLGKRKRGCASAEEGCSDGVMRKSSSDTRILVHGDWSRPRHAVKRRKR